MFNNPILKNTFTSTMANNVFSNIPLTYYSNDLSFTSTLRALLSDRVDKEECTFVRINTNYYPLETLKNALRAFIEQAYDHDDENQITLYTKNSVEVMEYIRNNLKSVFPSFSYMEDLSLFMKESNVDIYMDKERQNTLLFFKNMNMRDYHKIQSLIPRLLPRFFENSNITENEKDLLFSLTRSSSDEYERLIEIFAEKYDFRTMQIKNLLENYEKKQDELVIQRISREIDDYDRQIRNIEEDHLNKLRSRENLIIRKLGLIQRKNEKTENEVMEYFLCNNSLNIDSVHGSELVFVVKTKLDQYDLELFERYIDNEDSAFYDRAYDDNSDFSEDDIKLFFTNIFSDDPKLKINVCAAFQLQPEQSRVRGISAYDFDSSCINYLPNQHIQRHACLGGNELHINKCMANGDYVLAIEQCVAATKNINIADTTVLEEFMNEFLKPSAKSFVELPDGYTCTPREALSWLKENEEKKEMNDNVKTN